MMRKKASQKMGILVMIVIMLFTNIFTIIPAEAANLKGDVNSDNIIDLSDCSALKEFLLEEKDPDITLDRAAADVNQDLEVDCIDYSLLLQYVKGKISEFPKTEILYKDPAAPTEERVNDLLSRMTLEEKIGQMLQGDNVGVKNYDVVKYCLGSVLSGGGEAPTNNTPEEWLKMCTDYQNAALSTRLGIPILYGADAVHGHNNVKGATMFPQNIGLGAARDPELMNSVAKVTAEEMLSTGVNWDFAPCIAVARDERWGRTFESYGENTDLVCSLEAPFIKTLQGKYGILATAKHFLADGGTSGGVDQGNAVLTEEDLRKIHLPGYKTAIDSGVKSVMISFSSWNGLKNHENKYLITDLLKGELGFKGFVVSDWEAIHQISGDDEYTQVVKAVNAGIDMLMEPYHWNFIYDELETAVKKGDVPMDRINDAVRRILRVKFEMGLFEKPFGDKSLITSEVGSQQNREIARKAVRESLVLLKNDNHILPLKKNAKIFVTGPAANNIGIQCGGWTITWRGSMDYLDNKITPGTTILEGLKNIAEKNGGKIITDQAEAKEADVAVVVLGEKPYSEIYGDDSDLSLYSMSTALPGNYKALQDAKATGLPIVVILVSGRPRIVTDEINDWSAFVEAWLPGTEGNGISDVLYGDYDFTGKLPCTWPKSMDQIPINVDDMRGQVPLFPYDYGLKMFN